MRFWDDVVKYMGLHPLDPPSNLGSPQSPLWGFEKCRFFCSLEFPFFFSFNPIMTTRNKFLSLENYHLKCFSTYNTTVSLCRVCFFPRRFFFFFFISRYMTHSFIIHFLREGERSAARDEYHFPIKALLPFFCKYPWKTWVFAGKGKWQTGKKWKSSSQIQTRENLMLMNKIKKREAAHLDN